MTYDRSTRICPRCHNTYNDYPALSRRDNQTYICSKCGQQEAFEDAQFVPEYQGTPYWLTKEEK